MNTRHTAGHRAHLRSLLLVQLVLLRVLAQLLRDLSVAQRHTCLSAW